jgi:hypothetical protein
MAATATVFGTGIMLGFGCWLFDYSSIFIAKDASIFKGDEHEPLSSLEIFNFEFGNVLILQVAARPRNSIREFQSTL